jgi:hypothetical protein
MDCKTARLLLDFARPGAAELDPAEADVLERHLAGCPECDGQFHAERRLDQALGQAMRRVDLPPGLREQLLARLEADRGEWHRRRFGRFMRLAAAAAAAVLLTWGAWRWFAGRPTPLNPATFYDAVAFTPRGRTEVEDSFRRLGSPIVAPNVNYALLTAHGLAELPGYPGRVVPQLVFHHALQDAVVFVIDTRRFDLPRDFERPSGSRYQVEVLPQADDHFAYLVLYTGDNLAWLDPTDSPGA